MAVEAERAGAKLMYGKRFEGAWEDRSGLALPTLDLQAQFLIGADGARSHVAQFFGLGRNRRFLAGAEIECEPLPGLDARFLHCFADSKIAAGYIGWAVPGHGMTQIGVASVRGRKPQLSRLLARVAAISGGDTVRIVERRSGLIPTGGPVEPLGRGRVMLIGDAAGLVSPVTGGGIHTALHFGRRAAQLVGEYLYDRGGHPLAAFAREIPRYRLKRALRRVLDLAPPNALIDAMLMTAPLRALAQRLYFHRRSGDPASFEAWQEDFERGNMEPRPPSREQTLRCI
jgi:flavin-dependent dehydrogenase